MRVAMNAMPLFSRTRCQISQAPPISATATNNRIERAMVLW